MIITFLCCRWDVNPHVPNAFYSPTENKIGKIIFKIELGEYEQWVHIKTAIYNTLKSD